jgi:hypothetical protein
MKIQRGSNFKVELFVFILSVSGFDWVKLGLVQASIGSSFDWFKFRLGQAWIGSSFEWFKLGLAQVSIGSSFE